MEKYRKKNNIIVLIWSLAYSRTIQIILVENISVSRWRYKETSTIVHGSYRLSSTNCGAYLQR